MVQIKMMFEKKLDLDFYENLFQNWDIIQRCIVTYLKNGSHTGKQQTEELICLQNCQ